MKRPSTWGLVPLALSLSLISPISQAQTFDRCVHLATHMQLYQVNYEKHDHAEDGRTLEVYTRRNSRRLEQVAARLFRPDGEKPEQRLVIEKVRERFKDIPAPMIQSYAECVYLALDMKLEQSASR